LKSNEYFFFFFSVTASTNNKESFKSIRRLWWRLSSYFQYNSMVHDNFGHCTFCCLLWHVAHGSGKGQYHIQNDHDQTEERLIIKIVEIYLSYGCYFEK